MAEQHGRIVRAISGFYYVYTGDGMIRQCRARGVFKKRGIKPIVGDLVLYEPQGMQEGIVTAVLPRTSELIRPAIANVEQVLLVFSLVDPLLPLYQVDKMLAMVERYGLPVALLLTKVDLPGGKETYADVAPLYEGLGYRITALHLRGNVGRAVLEDMLAGKNTVLAGLSGVGKSTILMELLPDAGAVAGAISERGQRGRQTTTQVTLYPYRDGFLADSPGFSQFTFEDLEPDEVPRLFREIREVGNACEFRGCLHEEEDGCAVTVAVQNHGIAASRYEHYRQLLRECKEAKARRYQ